MAVNPGRLPLVVIILFGHWAIGRIFGYGLKYGDDFKHTHLGWIGRKNRSGVTAVCFLETRVYPGGDHALITSTSAGFYLGDRKDIYLSHVNFTPYTNFKERFGLPIRCYIELKSYF